MHVEHGDNVSWLTLADGTQLSIRSAIPLRARIWARILAEEIASLPEPHMGQPISRAERDRISTDGP